MIKLDLQPKRILLIKPSAIGDVVHTLPMLNLMRRRWPSAHIAWLLTPACATLLEGHPQLNEIILFDRHHYGTGWRNPKAAGGFVKFCRMLRAKKFDLVVDAQGLFRSGWMARATRAEYRVGLAEAREGARVFYTHRIADPEGRRWRFRGGRRHAVERNLDLAEAMGCGRSPVEFQLPVGQAERQWVGEKISNLGKYALVVPGTMWATKRWPTEKFAELGRMIRQRYGMAVVAAGAPKEFDLARQVEPDLNLAGQTNLRQLVALLDSAEIVVANDSGPMHIAAALGRPLVSLFGPTDPALTGPYNRPDAVLRLDIPCSPCFSRRCSHTSCLHLLKAQWVADQVDEQLKKRSDLP